MKVRDMTEGEPVRLILGFAVPLFIGNVFQQLYSLADTMIAGHSLGDGAIAAIGATSSIYTLIIYFASGLNSGYAILVTQRFGSHDSEGFKRAAGAMLILNLAGAALLTALAMLVLVPMMRFLNTPPAIFDEAYTYISIICGGMVTTLVYNMLASYLRAMGNSRTPLYFLMLSCLLNLSLDALFIMVLHMGVAGAALATVIAQAVSGLLCALYILRNYREYLPEPRHFAPDRVLIGEMLSTGLAMAMMQCVFAIGSVILQRAINGLGKTQGEYIITAHTAARRLIDILMMPLGTLSAAASTFVGQNWGAGRLSRVKEGLRKTLILEVCWGVIAAVLAYGFGEGVIRLMTGTMDVRVLENAVMNLRINFLFYPELGVLVCLRTSMQAMGQKIAPLFSSSLELAVKVVFSLWVIPVYGYVSASLTEPLTWLMCMLLLGGIFLVRRRATYARCPKPYDTEAIA